MGEGDDHGGRPAKAASTLHLARLTRRELQRAPTRVARRAVAPSVDPSREAGSPRPIDPLPSDARYTQHGILGSGGQGVVFKVLDAVLRREVALKTLRRPPSRADVADAILAEARAAARLGHPNIVPIFDVGTLADGRPHYTMPIVTGRSLADVFDALFDAAHGAASRSDGEPAETEWSLVRLVQVVVHVCNALQRAHEGGVIHRDVKPANIMLGAYGEVLLVDWGIAEEAAQADEEEPGSAPEGADPVEVWGSLPWMSPEQIAGRPLDARSDVHAIGAVLYEALTLHGPYERSNPDAVVSAILDEPPLDPRLLAPARNVPEALARLALRCLAKDPADRPAAAGLVARELQAFLERVADRARREREAAAIHRHAEELMERHEACMSESLRLKDHLAELEKVHPTWRPIAEKSDLIEERLRLAAVEREKWSTLLDAVNRYTDALAHSPDRAATRRALTDIFWPRFLNAERRQQPLEAETYRKLVERFHDERLSEELRGDGELRLDVWPAEAELSLHEQVEDGLILRDAPPRALGRGPVRMPLAMGSYVIVASAPGFEAVRYPVAISRLGTWTGEIRLPRQGALPPGFVFIPGMTVVLGGDEGAPASWPLREVSVRSFAMGRFPVTFGEYLEFLAAVDGCEGFEELIPRTPHQLDNCARKDDGTWHVSGIDWDRTRNFDRATGQEKLRRCAIRSITVAAVERYIAWRGERDGLPLRLPTAEEWELAARGADRRIHPWGWHTDPALCHTRDSMPEHADWAPVGTFETDIGPHGVRDLAGNITELTASWFDEARRFAEVRGSAWVRSIVYARGAMRNLISPQVHDSATGFRLACTMDESGEGLSPRGRT